MVNGFLILSVVLIALVIAYQLYVSRRVVRSRIYSDDQRIIQLIMIWLLPVVGASICRWMIGNAEAGDGLDKSQYTDDGSSRQDNDHGNVGGNEGGE